MTERLCSRCWAENAAHAAHCSQCGLQLEGLAVFEADAAADAGIGDRGTTVSRETMSERREGAIVWESRIPLLDNRFMAWDFLKVIVISVAIMWLLVFVIGWIADGEPVMLPLEIVGLVFGILVVLFVVSILLVYQNRFHVRFTVGRKGAMMETGTKEKRVNRVALIGGFLALFSGKPGPLGASLLAYSQEVTGIAWRDVRKVDYHPRSRVITLNNSWRSVLRLYCTPDNYERVAAMVGSYADEATRWRVAHPTTGKPIPWRRYVTWGALCILSAIAATAWNGEEIFGYALCAGASVFLSGLVAGPIRRVLAATGSLLTGALLWSMGSMALERSDLAHGLIVVYGYEHDTGLLSLAVGGAVVLLAMALWRLVGKGSG